MYFIVFYLEQWDAERLRLAAMYCGQYVLFFILFMTGWFSGSLYLGYYRTKYASYSFSTYARLADFKSTLVDGCSNLTKMPCSLQMHIDVFFFWTKCLLLYYSLLIITMIYMWHRTVRFAHYVITVSILADIIFHTDLIVYADIILYVSPVVSFTLITILATLMGYLIQNEEDPLSVLCGYNVSSDDLYEFLQNDPSKRARFYRWAKKMMQQWNIEEEKLIITIFVGVFITIILIILDCCNIPESLYK
jgi:hypothetical protein